MGQRPELRFRRVLADYSVYDGDTNLGMVRRHASDEWEVI